MLQQCRTRRRRFYHRAIWCKVSFYYNNTRLWFKRLLHRADNITVIHFCSGAIFTHCFSIHCNGIIVNDGFHFFYQCRQAVVSSREARLKAMAKSGSAGAVTALKLAADPGRFLSTVQSGITLITIVNGAFSGASLGEPVAQRLELAGLA